MALLALAGGSGVVFADATTLPADATEVSASGTSTAEFQVTPGKLKLDAVPDLNFGTTEVEEIATKDVTLLPLIDKEVTSGGNVTSKDMTAKNGNADLNLQVSDFRGGTAGWNLTAALGNFTANIAKSDKSNTVDNEISNGTPAHLSGVELKLVVKDNGSNNKVSQVNGANASATLEQNNGATPLLSAAKDSAEGLGLNRFSAEKDSTLKIPKDPEIKAATYQADITWTLGNTFNTAAAK